MGSWDTKSTPRRPTQEPHASAEEALGAREAAVAAREARATDREATLTGQQAAMLEREDAASLREKAVCAREDTAATGAELEALTEQLRDANAHLVVANVHAQTLAEQSQFLAALVNSTDDAIIATTLDAVVTSWNQGAERLYGYSSAEMIGRPIQVVVPPERAHEPDHHLEEIKRGSLVYRYDTERLAKNGRRIDVSRTVSPVWDASGALIAASIVARDISDLKRAEKKLRALLDAAPDATVLVDRSGRIVTVNAQVTRLLGYTRDELLGCAVEMLVPERHHAAHLVHRHEYLQAARARPMGAGLELTAVRKDGTEVPVEISLSPVETEEGTLVVAAIRDVTDRKRMTEALRLSEAHLKNALDVSHLGSWEVSIPPAPTDRWSEQTFRILGWNAADGLRSADEIRRVTHPEDVDRVSAQWSRAIRDLTRFDVEYRIIRPDGELRIVHSVGQPIKAGDGTTIRVVGTLQDVTDRRAAEAGREQLASIVDSSHDAIIGKTLDGIIVSWNKGAEQLYGYCSEEVIGKPKSILLPPDRSDELAAILARLGRGERIEHEETVRRRKDGTLVDVSLIISPVKNSLGHVTGASAIARDITDKRRAEHALKEAEAQLAHITRVATMGELASSIAHEVNQPLAAIVNDGAACLRCPRD